MFARAMYNARCSMLIITDAHVYNKNADCPVCTILAVKKTGHLNIKTKLASEYSHRAFASQAIRKPASKLFLC